LPDVSVVRSARVSLTFLTLEQCAPGAASFPDVRVADGSIVRKDEIVFVRPPHLKIARRPDLQEREFQRLGGTRLQKATVRVIAATNRDAQGRTPCAVLRNRIL
jgi:Sigma-54 interaction domain